VKRARAEGSARLQAPRAAASGPAAVASRPLADAPVVASAIAAVTVVAFVLTLQNDFINLDDSHNLVENPMIRRLGGPELRWMATAFYLGHWQPLTWLSFGLDHLVWGLNPTGYHLTNVILHAINAALCFLVAERLCDAAGLDGKTARTAAVVGTLLWSLHPLRVEAVAWATARRDLLSGTFVLLALLAYLQPESWRARVPAAVAAMLCAIASKESAMVLPALLVVLDVYPLGRIGGSAGWVGAAVRRVWLEKVPFLVLGVVAAAIAFGAQRAGGALTPLDELSAGARAAAVCCGLGFYLWKTVVPIDLRPMYEYPSAFDLGHPLALAGAATIVTAAAVSLALRRRMPALAAALVAYAAVLAPTLGIAQSGAQLVAERYSYLAMLAPSLVVGTLVAIGGAWLRPVAAVVLVGLAALTAWQTTLWRDSTKLWTRTIAVDPSNALARANLADVSFRAGDFTTAERELVRAVELRPDIAGLHRDLAIVLAADGRPADAVTEYREALRLRPGFAAAWSSLGDALAALGRDDDAMAAFRQAVTIDPGQMHAHAGLGVLLADRGRTDEAIAEYRAALRIEPSLIVYNNLGALLADGGQAVEAIPFYRAALALAPAAAQVHENLGHALRAAGDVGGAVAAYREALRLDPSLEGARTALADLGVPVPSP
jgi:tetratricopeptide (TPR) repeat protein